MEETQSSESTETQEQPAPFTENTTPGVSFPTVDQPKKNSGARTLLIIGILVLVGILGFVIFKSASQKSDVTSTEPTPFDNLTTPSQDQTSASSSAPIATPTTAPTAVDKASIKIQVQNGTGITGEAAYLQTQLKTLGYTNVKTGNSASQSLTATEVAFSKTLNATVVAEITKELNLLYTSVTTSTATSTTFDVVIATGLRKGATPKPSSTPVASPTATPKASPTATP